MVPRVDMVRFQIPPSISRWCPIMEVSRNAKDAYEACTTCIASSLNSNAIAEAAIDQVRSDNHYERYEHVSSIDTFMLRVLLRSVPTLTGCQKILSPSSLSTDCSFVLHCFSIEGTLISQGLSERVWRPSGNWTNSRARCRLILCAVVTETYSITFMLAHTA